MSPDEWREKIGQHIEQRREALHLSVKTAAKRAGVSPSLWGWLERGWQKQRGTLIAPNPKPETRAAVSAAMGWPPEALDNLAVDKPPFDPADAIVGDEALAEKLPVLYAEAFIEHGPAGLPDYAVNDDEYVRTLPAEMFAIFMLERARRGIDLRLATLEAQMQALRPMLRQLAAIAHLQLDDDVSAILFEEDGNGDSPLEM